MSERHYNSLSVWSATPTTNWIFVLGEGTGWYTDDTIEIIELSKYMYTVVDTMCVLNTSFNISQNTI